MYKLSEDITRMLVMSKLKDRPQIWLHSSENFLSFPAQELLSQLAEAFQSKESKITSRRKFQERKWHPDEDFAAYFNDKTMLAEHIRIDDEELIDSIIEGIPDTTGTHALCFRKPAVRCYNCNSVGHFAADCRKSKRAYGACYGCGSLEHLVSHCNEKKNATKNEYNA
ncbi:zinc finger CCHC domain-containing protein 9-like [Drosophila biarmipes]|uniref:zinc finger CCHC domain-containing protein 9-like n=1 Tax=Drosophila biarmipes TaxID=125945 RepID=UPI0021CC7EFA|nr:zinc finger CCHC domain-containing protein 9-like [Drosophila biarmipes]